MLGDLKKKVQQYFRWLSTLWMHYGNYIYLSLLHSYATPFHRRSKHFRCGSALYSASKSDDFFKINHSLLAPSPSPVQ